MPLTSQWLVWSLDAHDGPPAALHKVGQELADQRVGGLAVHPV
jgi:hypothetical protein